MLSRKKTKKSHLIWLLNSAGIVITFVVFFFFIKIKWTSQNIINKSQNQSIISRNNNLFPPQKNPNFSQINLELVSKFIEVKNVPFASFYYSGSSSWATIRKELEPQFRSVWPEFKIHYAQHPVLSPSSGMGIHMLIHNNLAFTQSDRPLKPEENFKANKKGLTLQQIPVALDGIVFAVNPTLNISGLTIEELRDIYTGKITNWKQVGGPDLEITVYSKSTKLSGTAQFFSEKVLLGQKLAPRVKIVENSTKTFQQVATNKGAIFYASAPKIVGQCTIKPLAVGKTSQDLVSPYIEPLVEPQKCPTSRNQINKDVFQNGRYPLLRYLYVIVKENGGIEEKAGLAYASFLLSEEGQRLIQKTGFVPVRF